MPRLALLVLALCLWQTEPGLAAALRTTMVPIQEGLVVRSVRALDASGEQIEVETADGVLTFTVPTLSPQLSPYRPTTSSAAASADSPTVRLQDGAIRWYDPGAAPRERLALLLLDRQRFVAWTPSGYYAAVGPDADDAIGLWCELADGRRHFVPAREFARDYHRPDIVRRVLTTPDEGQVIQQANQERGVTTPPPPLTRLLPAVGVLVGPEDGQPLSGRTAEVTIEVFDPTGVMVAPPGSQTSGRGLVTSSAAPRRREDTVSWRERVQVRLPPPPHSRAPQQVTIAVESRSLPGRPLSLQLEWQGGWRVSMPDLYLLTVGVNQYQAADSLPALRFAAKDARDLAVLLQEQRGKRYRRVFSEVLTNEQATLAEVRAKLAWLKARPQSRDVVMVFLAGHGLGSGVGSQHHYYFAAHDSAPDRLEQTALSDQELYGQLSRFRAQTVVLFLDTCRSGITSSQRRLLEELQAGSGIVVFSATKANRPSQERQRWQNGAFTMALLNGLRGAADVKNNGRITASGLENFIASRVRELTDGEQEPITLKATTDLWLTQSRPRYHRKWWPWTLLGSAVAASVITGTVIGLQGQIPQGPADIRDITFRSVK